jgi:hypothetical protein
MRQEFEWSHHRLWHVLQEQCLQLLLRYCHHLIHRRFCWYPMACELHPRLLVLLWEHFQTLVSFLDQK